MSVSSKKNPRHHTVVFPKRTADEWDLYRPDSARSAQAAQALNRAAQEAIDEVLLEYAGLSSEELAEKIQERFEIVADKWADTGAADTEPRAIIFSEAMMAVAKYQRVKGCVSSEDQAAPEKAKVVKTPKPR